jgi:class 3 adenylate cyclase
MFGLSRLSIQSKMILLLLLVSLLSIAIMAGIGYYSAQAALRAAVADSLQGTRVAKTTTLRAMLDSLRNQVISMSDSKIAISGMKAFKTAYQELKNETVSPEQKKALEEFYAKKFLPELAKTLSAEPVLEMYLPSTPVEQYLQYHYLVKNPHPYLKMNDLEVSETDKSSYGKVHEEFHKSFDRIVDIFGFEDVLLIDPDTLDIVYNYRKTSEFGTNLQNGPYSNTLLADKVRTISNSKDRDDFKIADFESYRPNFGRPMGFAISPIFDGSQMIGLLALQFPIDDFNKVLTGDKKWKEEGLGETGECYLVGPDRTMRSRSRFMINDPKAFVQVLRDNGMNSAVVDQVERQGNVMCVLPVKTESVDEAFKGKEGITVVTDYRGEEVLSAYGPLELDSLRWAVIAEMDTEEAYRPIREFGRTVLVVASGMAIAVTLMALGFSYLLTRPLRILTEGARRIGAGESDVRVNLAGKDEFGELGRVFNEMSDSIRKQKEELETQVQENQNLLLSILPASAVAQRQEGDEKASRMFSDVSVMFAELVGMEELSTRIGEAKSLSLLGDLITSFDEAGEKFGIEKVKTIGGSYLAVCGLSVTRPDHARRVVQFGQEMARIVSVFNREHQTDIALTAGVNSGPVVGGVVGRRKFLYDLWGDTVSIAKKLAVGKDSAIKVTSVVRERLGEQFVFSGPMRIDIEGKPPVEAWQVTG